MILSDTAIRHALTHNRLRIDPFVDIYVRPNSYDVHLHEHILVPRSDKTHENLVSRGYKPDLVAVEPDTEAESLWTGYIIAPDGVILLPGAIALGRTTEYFEFLDLAGRLEGVSTLGRIFLRVHVTAGFFDYNFKGTATVEIKNDGVWPIRLRPGMRIAQMAFEEIKGRVSNPYQGRYQGQIEPTASRSNNP